MMDLDSALASVSGPGLEAALERDWQVASLRHVGRDGAAAAALRQAGLPLPEFGRVVRADGADGAGFLLAARSPTETWVLTRDARAFAALAARFAGCVDGCWVDQSGGLWPLRLRGSRVEGLLARIATGAARMRAGEARITRVAEVTAMILAGESQDERAVVVERVYAAHLLGWIRATVG